MEIRELEDKRELLLVSLYAGSVPASVNEQPALRIPVISATHSD
jgi:hypothetical protein